MILEASCDTPNDHHLYPSDDRWHLYLAIGLYSALLARLLVGLDVLKRYLSTALIFRHFLHQSRYNLSIDLLFLTWGYLFAHYTMNCTLSLGVSEKKIIYLHCATAPHRG